MNTCPSLLGRVSELRNASSRGAQPVGYLRIARIPITRAQDVRTEQKMGQEFPYSSSVFNLRLSLCVLCGGSWSSILINPRECLYQVALEGDFNARAGHQQSAGRSQSWLWYSPAMRGRSNGSASASGEWPAVAPTAQLLISRYNVLRRGA